jgi:hypothetical protein
MDGYIRANRSQYSRAVLTEQLVAAGHDPAAVEAAWNRLSQGYCPECGTQRQGSLRYCASCGFDFARRPEEGPAETAPSAQPNPLGSSANKVVAGVIVILTAFAGWLWLSQQHSTPFSTDPPVSDVVNVRYTLTGSATSATITYTDSSGNTQQQSDVTVPMEPKSGTGTGLSFRAHRGDFVYFSAQNMGDSGDLTCTVEADGKVINTGHSSGGYTIVTCSETVP